MSDLTSIFKEADALRAYFMERGWTIHMEDNGRAVIDPFAAIIKAGRSSDPEPAPDLRAAIEGNKAPAGLVLATEWISLPVLYRLLSEVGAVPALQATGEPPHPLDIPHDSGQMRETLWRHHGHSEGLYGDDGERQCNHYPPVDFRRDHIDALLAHMRWSIEHEALWRAGATGEGEPEGKGE